MANVTTQKLKSTGASRPSAISTTYTYKGVDKRGSPIKGEINSTSPALAKAQLSKQGISVRSISKKSKPLFGEGGKAIKPADIAVFSRQMATMMKAGVPLVQAFDIVADGLENANLKKLVLTIRDSVAAGGGFAASLRAHPRYFDDLFCNLVDAGEQSGALETMLDRIATYKEKTEKLKGKIKKALTYPISVIVVAIIVTGILLVKVVPQFAETFSSFGAKLPAFTLFVLNLSEIAQAYWVYILLGIAASAFAFREARLRSSAFAYAIDKYTLKIPIIGNILYLSIMARFARTLSTTFAAGVPLIDALTSVAGSAGNRIYMDAIIKVREDVSTGIQLNTALKVRGMFPTLLIQMSAIGEESGALDAMLDKVAVYYEDAVDNSVDSLTSLLEPMIMSVLGVPSGWFVDCDVPAHIPTWSSNVNVRFPKTHRDFPLVGLITAGIVGLLVGSFLNVVIYRLPKMMEREWREQCVEFLGSENIKETTLKEQLPKKFNLITPNSTCPTCGHAIRPWENIPVVSYLLLRGKCAGCKTAISMRYPIIEAITGILSVIVIYTFGANATGLACLIFTWCLIALTMIDIDTQLLPDSITLPLLWLGLIANYFHLFTSLDSALWGAIAGYLSLFSVYWLFKLLTGKEGMGFGDFKLLAALGAWLGWQMLMQIILLSSLVGAVIGIGMIIIRGRDKNIPIPFGPYLAIAGWIALVWGHDINQLYLSYAVSGSH